jgi:hypothetical protein
MEAGTHVYGRQLNMETADGTVRVENHGGELAVLGFKTERSTTVCTTTDGGRTEILGGFLLWSSTPNGTPAWVNVDSEHTLSFMCTSYDAAKVPTTMVRETKAGVTRDASYNGFTGRHNTWGRVCPLHVGLLT